MYKNRKLIRPDFPDSPETDFDINPTAQGEDYHQAKLKMLKRRRMSLNVSVNQSSFSEEEKLIPQTTKQASARNLLTNSATKPS